MSLILSDFEKRKDAAQQKVAPCVGVCDWEDIGFGWQCKSCGLFYRHGLAPWEDDWND